MADKARPTSTVAVLKETRSKTAMKAYEMRREGRSWAEISAALHLEPRRVRRIVIDVMQEAADLVDMGTKQEMLILEIDRIDHLQSLLWPAAQAGDTRAVETILKLILARVKLLGLDMTPEMSVQNNTLVVAGTSEEYIAALRVVVNGGAEA